jgi:hypothetical protein
MIPESKIQELKTITNKNIINPQDVLVDSKGKTIGYTMRFVKDTYTLCQMFPKAFKQRENISEKTTLQLVKYLRELIEHIHSKQILCVDLNEMNFLINNKFNEIFAIDVDSYQTKSFPASALMESVRDRHAKNNQFNEGTDWFSFAITSFQMFIGIHPYKGKHDTYKTLDERMIKNISVLNSNVSLPPVCLPLSVIPQNYIEWYTNVLEKGQRIAPPLDGIIQTNKTTNYKTITGNNSFNINEMFALPVGVNFINIYFNSGNTYILTDQGVFLNNKIIDSNVYTKILFTPKNNILIGYNNNKLYVNGAEVKISVEYDSVDFFNNKIYIKSGSSILELEFDEMKPSIQYTKIIGNVMEKSTKHFSGCVIQRMLGSVYVGLYPKHSFFYELKCDELNAYKIFLDAKFINNVLFVNAKNSKGQVDQLIFVFNEDYSAYETKIFKDIALNEINFVVLDNGVVVHLNDNREIEIFFNKFGKIATQKKVVDPLLNNDMTLFNNGMTVMFFNNDKISSLKMK